MRLCICLSGQFEGTYKNSLWRKIETNPTYVIMHMLTRANWGDIWKLTLENSLTNATYATMHLFRRAIWGHIWKLILKKKWQPNATNATMHLFRRAIWGNIWKLAMEKNLTNANYVTMRLSGQSILRHTWKLIKEKKLAMFLPAVIQDHHSLHSLFFLQIIVHEKFPLACCLQVVVTIDCGLYLFL